MRVYCMTAGLIVLSAAFADTLTLRDGRVVTGTYLGGTARQVKMEIGDKIELYDVNDVSSLQFQGNASPAPRTQTRGNVLRPQAVESSSAQGSVELPAGTPITVRMIDTVDSENNRQGQSFRASLDEPVIVGGETVIPRGADAIIKLVDDKKSGKLTGRTELTLDLMSVMVNGRMVDLNTQTVTQASKGRGGSTAKAAGGGAALGAAIGAIAGGGRGAAIGAGSGAALGTGVQVLTKGQRVHIPSETRLTFTLETAIRI